MHAHAAETLAIGGTLAANAAVAVSSVTAELRQASQATRTQLAQVRAVLQLVQDRPALQGKVQLAYRDWVLDTDQVFEAVYQESEELTDEALVRALEGLVCGARARGTRALPRRPRSGSGSSCGATPTVRRVGQAGERGAGDHR